MSKSEKSFTHVTQFFGDKEYPFVLTFNGAVEWEENTGKSLMGTFHEMVERPTCRVSEVRELIRIALIGGGMPPVDAHKLINRYVNERPLSESVPVALASMEAFLFGTGDVDTENEKPVEEVANGE